MIILRTDMPIVGRNSVWCSELNIGTLTPTRRDKLVELLNLMDFVVRDKTLDEAIGEITKNGEDLVIRME